MSIDILLLSLLHLFMIKILVGSGNDKGIRLSAPEYKLSMFQKSFQF